MPAMILALCIATRADKQAWQQLVWQFWLKEDDELSSSFLARRRHSGCEVPLMHLVLGL